MARLVTSAFAAYDRPQGTVIHFSYMEATATGQRVVYIVDGTLGPSGGVRFVIEGTGINIAGASPAGGLAMRISMHPSREDVLAGYASFVVDQFSFSFDQLVAGGVLNIDAIFSGNDELNGDEGADVLSGFAGDDTIKGDMSDDVLSGGAGLDAIDGGTGVDTADYSDKTAPVVIALNRFATVTAFVGGVAEDTLVGIENLVGGSGDDSLTGTDEANLFKGGSGRDVIDGKSGSDVADYGDHSLPIVVFLAEAADATVFVGGAAEDTLRNVESVLGGSGDDTLVGDRGGNILKGGDGRDFLFSVGFNPDGTMKTLELSSTDRLEGGDGDDGLFGANRTDELYGGAGSDGLVGGAGLDRLYGGAGADFLFGGAFAGDGSVLPNSGDDLLKGDEGNDGLWGYDGRDNLQGDAGDDYLDGGDGPDTLSGGGGNDFVIGGAGDDILRGGMGSYPSSDEGSDYLYGGPGADTFRFVNGDRADWILDFNFAEGDRLVLNFLIYRDTAILADLSTPGRPAVSLTLYDSHYGKYDQLTVFGMTFSELNDAFF